MKAFLNISKETTIDIKRNDLTLTLKPVTMEKGSKGSFPGLLTSDFKRETFIDWLAKDSKTKDLTFDNFVLDAFNEMTAQLWKQVVKSADVEYDPKKKEARPEVKVSETVYASFISTFTENVLNLLSGESVKVKDSKYYRNEAMKVARTLADIKDPAKRIEAKAEANRLLALSKELEAKEESDLLAMLGEDETESTTETKVEETKTPAGK